MKKKSEDQTLIEDFQKLIDDLPELKSLETRRKLYFDLAVKQFLHKNLCREFFTYRFFNESLIMIDEAHIHLKFVIFHGDILPSIPKKFWITYGEWHYLCEANDLRIYQEMTIRLKTIHEQEIFLGEMPIYVFDDLVQIKKKCKIGDIDFIKDLFDPKTETPDLSSYYISEVFDIQVSFQDLKAFLQKIDKRIWTEKLQLRTELQKKNQLDYFVPDDLDKTLMLTQEEVDLLLAHVR